jgi:hypothetical protein
MVSAGFLPLVACHRLLLLPLIAAIAAIGFRRHLTFRSPPA